jgi:Protein-disulfide isomerase
LIADYQGKVALIFRHYPLDAHKRSKNEAMAAECTAEYEGDGAFWKFIDKVFEVTPSNDKLDPAKLPEIAVQIGANKDDFNECMKSGKFMQRVESDFKGGTDAGVRGTPTAFVVNEKGDVWFLPGAYPKEQIKALIEAAMKE